MTLLADRRLEAIDGSLPQRRHLRFPVSWAAEVRAGQARPHAVRVIDVSQGGIGVVADDMLPAACVLDLRVRLRDAASAWTQRELVARAKVIHQVFAGGRTRAGLQFVDIAADDVRCLVESARRGS